MKKLLFFLLLTSSVCFFHCKKEGFSPNQFFECVKSSTLSESEMHDLLIGEWEWFYILHGWTAKESGSERRGRRLVFKANGKMEVFQNDSLVNVADWVVKSSSGGGFFLETTPSLEESLGGLGTCNGEINFDARADDGDANFYKKK